MRMSLTRILGCCCPRRQTLGSPREHNPNQVQVQMSPRTIHSEAIIQTGRVSEETALAVQGTFSDDEALAEAIRISQMEFFDANHLAELSPSQENPPQNIRPRETALQGESLTGSAPSPPEVTITSSTNRDLPIITQRDSSQRTADTLNDLFPKDNHPDEYCCPIGYSLMTDPVKTTDGFTFERSNIEKWFNKTREPDVKILSPLTGEPLSSLELTPNHTLKEEIDKYKAKAAAKAAARELPLGFVDPKGLTDM